MKNRFEVILNANDTPAMTREHLFVMFAMLSAASNVCKEGSGSAEPDKP
jgi:hypothetical protein